MSAIAGKCITGIRCAGIIIRAINGIVQTLSVNALVNGAGIVIIHDADSFIHASPALAKVTGARVVVITIGRNVSAGAVQTLVSGAGVAIIKDTGGVINAVAR